ncbi:hypothetical protein JNW91_03430 [Micromonospora sp. STR1_7]|uniref:Uncharacterized protein n=1 Tax=Micromonospora parastrephiae TaxID=2806101 RepID=A0ABS1XP84_9ACTN|nr:hypothetical protein [Micromonospora parastrephiae]MBM0231009.1 hypothetical protein [Micromonospora parastrephiae]
MDLETPAPVPWWKKPITWVITVCLTMVGAVITTYGTDMAKAFLGERAAPEAVAERAAQKSPLIVVDQSRVVDVARSFVLPQSPSDGALQDWDRSRSDMPTQRWLNDQGAVDVGTSYWQITFQGTRTEVVEIVNIRPVLEDGRCAPAIAGVLVENATSGATDKIPLTVAIDRPNPRLLINDGSGDAGKPFFDLKKISLPRKEKNVVVVSATTSGPYCRWRLAVEYLADGHRGEMMVSAPEDRPYAVTGTVSSDKYSDVFIASLWQCGEPRKRLSGPEYLKLQNGDRSVCG